MSAKTGKNNGLTITAYAGDAKTLLAFNLDKKSTAGLAGFTIQCKPKGQDPYYLQNQLRFKTPGDHAQDARLPATSSINAPIHKFRWLHVPGSIHQGLKPFFGPYTYTVTPRYFDEDGSMQPIDPGLSASVAINVGPFTSKKLSLGFTRGFTQSQAFVQHFGLTAKFRPAGKDLLFDTSQISGTNAEGKTYTFQDEYEWLGFTARERIFEILDEVTASATLTLDVFAYDLNEPDIMGRLLKLAKQGRVRMILDNATLHHDDAKPKPEDTFEAEFNKAATGSATIMRGKFGRFAHDKVLIVRNKSGAARRVLTGSTNFSVTGLYVNSNHVLVFDEPTVAAKYAEVFDAALAGEVKALAFSKSSLATQTFSFSSAQVPRTEITFSPHQKGDAKKNLDALSDRVKQEAKAGKTTGSVLFAVMEMATGTGSVFPTLRALHSNSDIFSYGITDTPDGISLYEPGSARGVLVTGKPTNTKLPPPFNQVPGVGLGHQVHHKFVVCGFNGKDPVVFCGSSNLAEMGEQVNGDNLLAIYDEDVATVFAIEALGLVDHFTFLDRASTGPKKPKFASKQEEAASAGWFLSTTDKWAKPYYDPKDLKFVDRELFGT